MSMNPVVFRTERIQFHMALVGGRRQAASLASERASGLTAVIAEVEEPPAAGHGLIERLEAARARLGQLTFYLFDPNSWR